MPTAGHHENESTMITTAGRPVPRQAAIRAVEGDLHRSSSELPSSSAPRLVLDTNIVLDWLHFGDPSCGALGRAIERGDFRWIATDAMRRELESVLHRGIPGRRPMDLAGVLRSWDRWVVDAQRPDSQTGYRKLPNLPVASLRCRDTDDQKFIDFALAAGASALLSRDRAVLRLARPAAAYGLRILTAADWRPEMPC